MIQAFFTGMFLFNAIPHLVKGITGETHMTPFKRVSSPRLNIVWAFANIVLAVLLCKPMVGVEIWAFVAGGLFMSLANAWLFGKPNARFPWHKD